MHSLIGKLAKNAFTRTKKEVNLLLSPRCCCSNEYVPPNPFAVMPTNQYQQLNPFQPNQFQPNQFQQNPYQDQQYQMGHPYQQMYQYQSPIPKGILGQPTCHTHPHLIEEGCLTQGITQEEYKERRDNLIQRLSSAEGQDKDHIVILPAATKQYMTDKIPYPFRQHSDFYYFTGCLEPSAALVLFKRAYDDNYKSFLFVKEKDKQKELWEGPRTGCEAAKALFAVDEAQPIEHFETFFNLAVSSRHMTMVWYKDKPVNHLLHSSIHNTLRSNCMTTLIDPMEVLHSIRLIKSPAEINLMKETCKIGSKMINEAMAHTGPGVSEHILNAVMQFECCVNGAEHLAFPPVIAGGPRATHIHYINNSQLLKDGELVLIDAGCQKNIYNSDISRTYPVSGKFSKHQKILYELVLSVQKQLLQILKEERVSLDELFNRMCSILGKSLQQEGILPKNLGPKELKARAFDLCPHHVSHYLGLDVHDTSFIQRSGGLSSNIFVTVEPGIYIQPDDKTIPEEFRGIGIRIEDDVLVTDTDAVVMTNDCAKDVSNIELIVGTSVVPSAKYLAPISRSSAAQPSTPIAYTTEMAGGPPYSPTSSYGTQLPAYGPSPDMSESGGKPSPLVTQPPISEPSPGPPRSPQAGFQSRPAGTPGTSSRVPQPGFSQSEMHQPGMSQPGMQMIPGMPQGTPIPGMPQETMPGMPREMWSQGVPQGMSMPGMPQEMSMPGMPQGMSMPGMPQGMSMPGMPQGMSMPGMPQGMSMPGIPQEMTMPGMPQEMLPQGMPMPGMPQGMSMPGMTQSKTPQQPGMTQSKTPQPKMSQPGMPQHARSSITSKTSALPPTTLSASNRSGDPISVRSQSENNQLAGFQSENTQPESLQSDSSQSETPPPSSKSSRKKKPKDSK